MSNSLQEHREDVELLQVSVNRYLYEWRHFIREWEVPDSARAADWRDFTPYKERPTIGWSHEFHLREGLSKVLQLWHLGGNLAGLDAQTLLDLRRFVEWESDSRPEPNLPNQSTMTVAELLRLCERVASQLDLVLVGIDRLVSCPPDGGSPDGAHPCELRVTFEQALEGVPEFGLSRTAQSTLYRWVQKKHYAQQLGVEPGVVTEALRLRVDGLKLLQQRGGRRRNSR